MGYLCLVLLHMYTASFGCMTLSEALDLCFCIHIFYISSYQAAICNPGADLLLFVNLRITTWMIFYSWKLVLSSIQNDHVLPSSQYFIETLPKKNKKKQSTSSLFSKPNVPIPAPPLPGGLILPIPERTTSFPPPNLLSLVHYNQRKKKNHHRVFQARLLFLILQNSRRAGLIKGIKTLGSNSLVE